MGETVFSLDRDSELICFRPVSAMLLSPRMKAVLQKNSLSKPWKKRLAAFPMLGKRPLIIGVITTFAEARAALRSRTRPYDILEWRLDLTGLSGSRWRQRCRDLEQSGARVLLTIRSAAEGGKWSGSDAERLALYRQGLAVVSMVDVEINSRILPEVVEVAHQTGKPVIGSFHDFSKTPPARVLAENISRGWKNGADVVKLATKLNAEKDLELLLKLIKSGTLRHPLCLIGMGPPEARVALARAGSCFAYGFLGKSAAPGQVPCVELRRQLQNGADERS